MRDTLIDQFYFYIFYIGKRNAFQDKTKASVRQKQANEMFFILFYPKTTSSLLLLFFDGPSATVELITQHVYPAFGCGVNNLVFYAQSISTVVSG